MPGLYIHVPFCVKKCRYCAFHSVPFSEELVKPYIEALRKEAILRKRWFSVIYDTIYIGGGTPSVLKSSEISEILEIVTSNFNLSVKEFTIEVNPGTVDVGKLNHYESIGIKRISIGIQSLIDGELEYLGRIHTSSDAIKCFEMARNSGFNNISVDLIYGIPIQDRGSWHKTLEGISFLRPNHISAYSLSYEPGTPLYREEPMDEGLEEMLYYQMIEYLHKKGYNQYEISSFAIKGFESKHNLNYWNGGIYLGLGPSAHSYDGTYRYANPLFFDYINHKESKKEKIDRKKEIKEYIMLGLRKREGISLDEVSQKFGKKIYSKVIEEAQKIGLEFEDGKISIPVKKQFLADALILSIITALGENS